jgi:hypothetical protein
MKNLFKFLVFSLLVFSGACSKLRNLASGAGPGELPPVVVTNVPYSPADQIPWVKTEKGYVAAPLPGVTLPPPAPLKYVTFVGQSD